MSPGDALCAADKPSGRLRAAGRLAGVIACVVLFVSVQVLLLRSTTGAPGGGMGRALGHWIFHSQSPPRPVVWYQLPAPIAKDKIKDLPPDVARRAGPILGWLIESRGLQRGESLRILPGQDDLTFDISGIDEIGCRLIMQAARSSPARISSINVTGAAADAVAVPTSVDDDEQCKKATGFMRMIHASSVSHDK